MTQNAQIRRWPSMRWGATVLVCAMMAVVFVPTLAVADEADGLQALRSANDAFDEEKFEDAYDYYDEAYEILGVEMIKYRLGQTAEELGWAERAIGHYEIYREIGDDEEFLSRIDDSMPVLRDEVEVTLKIVSDPEGAQATISGADEELEGQETPASWTLMPGEVTVTLELSGYAAKSHDKVLEAGGEYQWEATLEEEMDEEPEPVADVDDPSEDDIIEEADEDAPELAEFDELEELDEEDSSLALWGWTMTGVGASALAFGGVMSLFQSRTTSEVNELDRAAAGSSTADFEERENIRNEQQALRDDANTYYRISTGAFIAGGVLTAAGTGLLLHNLLGTDEEGTDEGLSIHGGVDSNGGIIGIGGRF